MRSVPVQNRAPAGGHQPRDPTQAPRSFHVVATSGRCRDVAAALDVREENVVTCLSISAPPQRLPALAIETLGEFGDSPLDVVADGSHLMDR
jgi:hypothetical protein